MIKLNLSRASPVWRVSVRNNNSPITKHITNVPPNAFFVDSFMLSYFYQSICSLETYKVISPDLETIIACVVSAEKIVVAKNKRSVNSSFILYELYMHFLFGFNKYFIKYGKDYAYNIFFVIIAGKTQFQREEYFGVLNDGLLLQQECFSRASLKLQF